jgi:hypothetical protein
VSLEELRKLIQSFANHVHLPEADQRLVHVLWLIDTEHYTEAMNILRDPLAGSQLLSTPWAGHVLQILVDAEKWKEALTLLTLCNHLHGNDLHITPTRARTYNDAVLHVRILLHNHLLLPAFSLIVRPSISLFSSYNHLHILVLFHITAVLYLRQCVSMLESVI